MLTGCWYDPSRSCQHPRVGRRPPQAVSLLEPPPTLSPSLRLAQSIFEPNLSPYQYPNILNPSLSSYLPPCEDGQTEFCEKFA